MARKGEAPTVKQALVEGVMPTPADRPFPGWHNAARTRPALSSDFWATDAVHDGARRLSAVRSTAGTYDRDNFAVEATLAHRKNADPSPFLAESPEIDQ